MLGIFVLLCMYDVNALLVEEKKLQSSNAFPNINFLTSSNKLSIIYIYIYIEVNYQNSYLPLQFNYNLKT